MNVTKAGTTGTSPPFLCRLTSMRLVRFAIDSLVGLTLWIALASCLARVLIVEQPLDRADAIVVLSGSETYIERVEEAASLYKAGVSSKILLTNDGRRGGWDESEKRNPYFFERARWELIRSGVPKTAIEVLMSPGDGTFGEAHTVIDNAVRSNQTSILIVTSPYHTRRALWTYQKIDSTINRHLALGMKSASNGHQSPKWYDWWLYSTGWKTIASEYAKLAYYNMRY